jgi:hypothetical protein
MSNFTEIKTGGWDDYDPLTGDQVSSIQDTLLKAPNFSEGCTFTPAAAINVLGEHGMQVATLLASEISVTEGDALSLRVEQILRLDREVIVIVDSEPTVRTSDSKIIFVCTLVSGTNHFHLRSLNAVAGDVKIVKVDPSGYETGLLVKSDTDNDLDYVTKASLSLGEKEWFLFNGHSWEVL